MQKCNKDPLLIVGAGASAYLCASVFAEKNISHLLLEAGEKIKNQNIPFFHIKDPKTWRHKSTAVQYEWIRTHAIGGKTVLWGAWCDDLKAYHLDDANVSGNPWPISFSELSLLQEKVKQKINIHSGKVSKAFQALSKTLSLPVIPKKVALSKNSNEPTLSTEWSPHSKTQPQSVALRVICSKDKKVEGLEYLDLKTKEKKLLASDTIVLCASAFETARILHESFPLFRNRKWHFTDHLVASFLVVLPTAAQNQNKLSPIENLASIPRFININGKNKRGYHGGFTLELKGPMSLKLLREEDLEALKFSPHEAHHYSCYIVHAIGESFPCENRFIRFDNENRDALNRPEIMVNWEWNENDKLMAKDMLETAEAVSQTLAIPGSRIIEIRNPLFAAGAGHECGTCRIGTDANTSIVDPSGKVHGIDGLYIADASIMPTVLDGHPSLPLLTLSMHVAENITKDLQKRN